ncbi:unnamed protein product [Withania somnifera]
MVDSLLDTLEYFQDFLENISKERQKYCGKAELLEREIRTPVEKAEDMIELKIHGTMEKEGLSKTFFRTLVEKIDALQSEKMGSRLDRNKVLVEQRESEALRKTLLPFVEKIDSVRRNVMGSSFGKRETQDYGMGRIGKTTLARKALDDFEISHRFDIHIWVIVSQEYRITDMLWNILRCTSDETNVESNDLLMDLIYKNSDFWDLMTRNDNNGSRIILTSRQEEVAKNADLFGVEHACPPELVHIGKQVAQRCQVLPLALLVVAGHQSKISRTREVGNMLPKAYNYLPDHLKSCFLYMGVFPEGSGFLSDESEGRNCLEDLVSRNLVMVRNRSFNCEAKAVGVHDLIRDLISREAEKEKFLQVTRIREAASPSKKKFRSARRCSFHSHDQTAFWKLSNITEHCTSLMISKRQVPLCASFKLLRITKLVQLRYLQFTCHDDIHFSVSELYNLQTFILGHLVEGLLPPTLLELSCLALTSCTFELYSAIPNLKKLKIIGNHPMEMKREHLNSLSCLQELEILKFRGDGLQTSRIPSTYALPTSLKRLTLSYTCLPWEDMANIVMLPNLELLKIKHNGFVGDVWKLNDEEIFNQLKFLLISWTGLKHWEAGGVNFPKMQCLFLERCTNLSIELHDCCISAAKSIKEIQEEQESMGNGCLSVLIYNNLRGGDHLKHDPENSIMVIQAPLPLQSVNAS